MNVSLLALAMLWVAGVATAQIATVQTGEHGAFTRVVIDFDLRPEWTAGRTDDGFAIRFEQPFERAPNLDRAFDLITRDRISDIEVDTALGLFAVTLACVCWVDVVEYQGEALIVDIRPGPAPEDALFENRLRWPTTLAPRIASFVPEPPTFTESAPQTTEILAPFRPVIVAGVSALPAPPGRSVQPDSPPLAGRRQEATAETVPPDDAVSALASEVARAVAQGLLEYGEKPPKLSTDRIEGATPDVRNVSVTSAVDAALGLTTSQRSPLDGISGCIPVARIDVAAWAPPDGIRSLGALRRDAIAEDGRLTQSGLLSLARAYVHLGFGAEARSIARLMDLGMDRDVLLALAEIVDHGGTNATVLDDQFSCSPEAAVWRALAKPFEADDLPRDIAPILASFSALPVTLRVHLGTVLAERLRLAGFPSESRIALNTVARGGNESIEQTLTVARLDLTGTRSEDARARLQDLATGTGLTAAEALVELLEDARRRGTPPDPQWVDDAPSLVRATRGTEVARHLARASLQGGIALDRFDVVRRALADGPSELTVADTDALLVELATAVLARGRDAPFLKVEVLLRQRIRPLDLDDSVRLAFLSRFLDLGLSERALDYASQKGGSAEEQVLIATAYARIRDFDQAIGALDGVFTDRAQRARADILSAAGRAQDASTLYLTVEDLGNGTREAIRAADWDAVDRLMRSTQSEPGDSVTAKTDPSAMDAPNTALLSSMADRRAALTRLLDLTTVD